MGSNFLNDYVSFVDHTTSDPSKHISYFKETCDVVKEQGMAPERMLTAALGLSGESGEFTEIVKKVIFQGKPMDEHTRYHMQRELGDVMWYVAQACIAFDMIETERVLTIDEKLGKILLLNDKKRKE